MYSRAVWVGGRRRSCSRRRSRSHLPVRGRKRAIHSKTEGNRDKKRRGQIVNLAHLLQTQLKLRRNDAKLYIPDSNCCCCCTKGSQYSRITTGWSAVSTKKKNPGLLWWRGTILVGVISSCHSSCAGTPESCCCG